MLGKESLVLGKARAVAVAILLGIVVGCQAAPATPAAAPPPVPTTAPAKPAASTAAAQAPAAASAAAPVPAKAAPVVTEWKISNLVPLTGQQATYGVEFQAAGNIAQDEINKAGGIAGRPLKMDWLDTASIDPARSASLTKKLLDSDLVIMGPQFSTEAEVAAPIAVQGKITMIGPGVSNSTVIAANQPWFFSMQPLAQTQDESGMELWLKKYPNIKKIAIEQDVQDASPVLHGKIHKDQLDRLHMDNKVFEHLTKDVDFSAQIRMTKSYAPDGVLVVATTVNGGQIVREIVKQGLKVPILMAQSNADAPTLKAGGEAMEGVNTINAFNPNNPDPKFQAFKTELLKRDGLQAISQTAPNYYDVTRILAKVFADLGLTGDPGKLADERTKIRDGIAGIQGFPSINGFGLSFKSGQAVAPVLLLLVKGGQQIPDPAIKP